MVISPRHGLWGVFYYELGSIRPLLTAVEKYTGGSPVCVRACVCVGDRHTAEAYLFPLHDLRPLSCCAALKHLAPKPFKVLTDNLQTAS